jgi:hypothetical protein
VLRAADERRGGADGDVRARRAGGPARGDEQEREAERAEDEADGAAGQAGGERAARG